MSVFVCVALMASGSIVAQDKTPKKDAPKKEACCKDKKSTECTKDSKKECCKDKATKEKKSCCQNKTTDKKTK